MTRVCLFTMMSAAVIFGSGSWRDLPGGGRIQVPARLEGPVERDRTETSVVFQFRTAYPWYRFDAMGSGTPWREELFVAIGGSGGFCSEYAAAGVKPLDSRPLSWNDEMAGKREKRLEWRDNGPYRVAEGLYTVNGLKDRVVVVSFAAPERRAEICYRVWRRDASAPEAIRVVQDAAQSLKR